MNDLRGLAERIKNFSREPEVSEHQLRDLLLSLSYVVEDAHIYISNLEKMRFLERTKWSIFLDSIFSQSLRLVVQCLVVALVIAVVFSDVPHLASSVFATSLFTGFVEIVRRVVREINLRD